MLFKESQDSLTRWIHEVKVHQIVNTEFFQLKYN